MNEISYKNKAKFSKYFQNTKKQIFSAEFDLCDEINCQLRKISFLEPYTSGLNVFHADLTYLIVTYERKYIHHMVYHLF